MDRTIAQLEIGEEGRRVARAVLSQPAPLVVFPVGLLFGLASVSRLPPRIRSDLGLRWNPKT